MNEYRRVWAFAFFIAALGPYPSYAQDSADGNSDTVQEDSVSGMRQYFMLDMPATLIPRAVGLPGSSLSTPTAYGADWGDVYAVAVYQERVRFADLSDGAVGAGFGLGNARKTAGVELTFTSFNLFKEGEEDVRDVSFSFKLHRALTSTSSIAAGVENAARMRGRSGDSGRSIYLVGSHTFRLRNDVRKPFSIATASLGIGSGRFRTENQIDDGSDRPNVFASAGIRVVRSVALIGDWTGQDLNVGVSVIPVQGIPVVATAALADITGSAGNGARFLVGIGCGFNF